MPFIVQILSVQKLAQSSIGLLVSRITLVVFYVSGSHGSLTLSILNRSSFILMTPFSQHYTQSNAKEVESLLAGIFTQVKSSQVKFTLNFYEKNSPATLI